VPLLVQKSAAKNYATADPEIDSKNCAAADPEIRSPYCAAVDSKIGSQKLC
jgi:hypothetical protein